MINYQNFCGCFNKNDASDLEVTEKRICLDVFAGVNWSKTAVSNKFMALLTAEFCAYDHHFLLMRKR